MPVPSWPQATGKPITDGFRSTFPVLGKASEVDSGPKKQSRTTTARPFMVQLVYVMTSAERDWLETFWFEDAAGGAVWFEWWHPVKQAVRLARFVADQPPAYEAYKPDWKVGVTLEVRA